MWYSEYKTLTGDVQSLAKSYADFCNAMEWCESKENANRFKDEFIDEVSEVLDRYIFSVDPDRI